LQKLISSNENIKQRKSALYLTSFLVVLIALALFFNLMTENMFLESKNVKIIISNSIYPTFMAWGLCFLFACGYTDLSIGAVVILGSFASCALGNIFGYPGVILGGFIVGTALVFINFIVFAYSKIPSWIASICLALIYEAISVLLLANRKTNPYFDAELAAEYRAIGQMPLNVVLLILGYFVVYMIYNRTSIGLDIRAIGGNQSVARSLGININKTLIWVGLITGILIAVASIVQQSYNVKTTTITGLLSIQTIFKPLAIALLAQILQKWINIIIAVPFCSIIIYAVFNVMTFFGVPSGTLQDVILGVLIIIFGIGGQLRVREVVK
jgi:ribose transport system permease protein